MWRMMENAATVDDEYEVNNENNSPENNAKCKKTKRLFLDKSE